MGFKCNHMCSCEREAEGDLGRQKRRPGDRSRVRERMLCAGFGEEGRDQEPKRAENKALDDAEGKETFSPGATKRDLSVTDSVASAL